MTRGTQPSLGDLQALDDEIAAAEDQVGSYEPQIAEADEPALQLEQDLAKTHTRLQEMRLEERRFELSSEEKRNRVKMLEKRLQGVRNVREEAAVSSELEMVRRALEGDDQEAFMLMDQIRKLEMRQSELEDALEVERAEIEPRRQELLTAMAEAETALGALRGRRSEVTAAMETAELRVYESIRGNGRRRAVSPMTDDGACGHCFSVIPLQLQHRIRVSADMIRCEGCGVILTAPVEDEEE